MDNEVKQVVEKFKKAQDILKEIVDRDEAIEYLLMKQNYQKKNALLHTTLLSK